MFSPNDVDTNKKDPYYFMEYATYLHASVTQEK